MSRPGAFRTKNECSEAEEARTSASRQKLLILLSVKSKHVRPIIFYFQNWYFSTVYGKIIFKIPFFHGSTLRCALLCFRVWAPPLVFQGQRVLFLSELASTRRALPRFARDSFHEMCLNTYKQGNELAQNSRDKQCDRFSFIEPNSKSRREKNFRTWRTSKMCDFNQTKMYFWLLTARKRLFSADPQIF